MSTVLLAESIVKHNKHCTFIISEAYVNGSRQPHLALLSRIIKYPRQSLFKPASVLPSDQHVPTEGLLLRKSYSLREPIQKLERVLPVWMTFLELVMAPVFMRSTTPSLIISEWMPRSRWLPSSARTASGIEPIPKTKR